MFSASVKSRTSPRRWRSSGMWPSPASKRRAGPLAGDVRAGHDHLPLDGLAQAGDRVDQLALPVAVHACDRDDLTGADLERDALHGLQLAIVEHLEVVEPRGAARPAAPGSSRRAAAPRGRPSSARASPASRLPARTVSISFPRRRTVMRSAISSTSLSLCVMKMTDMPSFVSERRIPNSSRRLLRREHRRRLVEDQDVGAAVERLQDLDALLLADADVLARGHAGRSRS